MRIAALLSLAAIFAGCSRPRWVEVRSESGEFTVSMPTQPAETKQSKDFETGRLTWVNYNVNKGETSFMVSYVDYPDTIMTGLTSERILASGIERMMATRSSARKIKDSDGRFEGYPCKDFEVADSVDGFTSIGRQLLVGRRQYLIQVNTPSTNSASSDVRRFLDSFRLAKPENGPANQRQPLHSDITRTLAGATNEWDLAVIKGMTTMNKGDGKSFAENAHTDFKYQMRRDALYVFRIGPTNAETLKNLKEFGVSTVDELETIPLDTFIEKMIHGMHYALPRAVQFECEQAELKPISSELQGDVCRCTVELSMIVNGKSVVRTIILLAKKEGKVWKYNGQAK